MASKLWTPGGGNANFPPKLMEAIQLQVLLIFCHLSAAAGSLVYILYLQLLAV